jgi:ABC-type lipoprotein export system ATPase subunit
MQGIGESAYIKSLMMKNFNKSEVDTLTNEIIKHIPQSFNLLDADKYKQDYLQAVKEIKQENNAKDNLWDRFLNILAGGIPFKQTPEERVMMRRWIDGERGEL